MIYQNMMTDMPTYYTSAIKKGFCLHTTGANNPYLKRYVAPDLTGFIGANRYGNSWNDPKIQKSVTFFVGKGQDEGVRAVQVQPIKAVCWHVGNRTSNRTYVACEICEDDLRNPQYFEEAINCAAEAAAYTLEKLGITQVTKDTVTSHYELWKRGLGSGHSDPQHWFVKMGYSMDKFRELVRYKMGQKAHWAAEWMAKAAGEGLMTAERPDDNLTRGEASVIAMRLVELFRSELDSLREEFRK